MIDVAKTTPMSIIQKKDSQVDLDYQSIATNRTNDL